MRTTRRLAVLLGAAAMLMTAGGNAQAAAPKFSDATTIGTHNAYDKAKYTYFAQALDSGASLLELDVYTQCR